MCLYEQRNSAAVKKIFIFSFSSRVWSRTEELNFFHYFTNFRTFISDFSFQITAFSSAHFQQYFFLVSEEFSFMYLYLLFACILRTKCRIKLACVEGWSFLCNSLFNQKWRKFENKLVKRKYKKKIKLNCEREIREKN